MACHRTEPGLQAGCLPDHDPARSFLFAGSFASTGTMTRRLQILLTVLFLVSCRGSSSTGTGPVPAITPEPSPSAPRISSTRDRWTITPVAASHRFTSVIHTAIELQEPAGIQRDSLISSFTYSLSIERSGETVSYSARVESMSAHGGARITSPMGALTSPFSFSGQLEKNKISVDSAVTDCSNDALASVPVIQRALVVTPVALHKDMTWSDSVSSAVCSGSIPVTTTSVRNYRVVGETPHGILIERHDHTTAAGEGSQGQHLIRLKTDGSGMAQITIDSRTGELLQVVSTSTTTAIVTASGRDRRFVQTVQERINRLD